MLIRRPHMRALFIELAVHSLSAGSTVDVRGGSIFVTPISDIVAAVARKKVNKLS